MKRILILLIGMGCLFSCRKEPDEIINQTIIIEGTDTIIDNGNIIPPDTSISQISQVSYVNKLYISLLGREPLGDEMDSALSWLSPNASVSQRKTLVEYLVALPAYRQKLFDAELQRLIEDNDIDDVVNQIYALDALLMDSTYVAIFPQIQYEKERLEALRDAEWQYRDQMIDIRVVHKAMIHNDFYDQINMGTENFVVSSFQHFLLRYPTHSELDNSKIMVDGFPANLFGELGTSKLEYMDILFSSSNYHEGLIRDAYVKFLFRQPHSVEIDQSMGFLESSFNHESLITKILISDEYLGL